MNQFDPITIYSIFRELKLYVKPLDKIKNYIQEKNEIMDRQTKKKSSSTVPYIATNSALAQGQLQECSNIIFF